MTEDKASSPGESPFNLDALEEMESKKSQGIRTSKPKNYQTLQYVAKPSKKPSSFDQPNPWTKGAQVEDEVKPDAPSDPQAPDDIVEETITVKETAIPESVVTDATDTTAEDDVSKEEQEPAVAESIDEQEDEPTATETTPPESVVAEPADSTLDDDASKEAEKSRLVGSMLEQAEAQIKEEKVKRAGKFRDEAIDGIVSDKASKKIDKKKTRIAVVTIGSGVATVIGKGIDGVAYTGKAVAGAAGSGAKAAVNLVESGVKGAAQTVGNAVKSVKPSGDSGKDKEKDKEDSIILASAKTATSVTERVADGVLAVGSGVGRITGYVARGAVSAPVDIARGVSGVVVDVSNRVTKLFLGSKKKSGRND